MLLECAFRRLLAGFCSVVVLVCPSLAQQPELPLVVGEFQQEMRRFFPGTEFATSVCSHVNLLSDAELMVESELGVFRRVGESWLASEYSQAAELKNSYRNLPETLRDLVDADEVLAIARSEQGIAVGARTGLFWHDRQGSRQVFPEQGNRRWAPTHVCVDFDREGRLWFSSFQGAGCYWQDQWQLFEGRDGLPIESLTSVACGPKGAVWFGSMKGAMRYDGSTWSYRQGLRWLPGDQVHDVAVDAAGNAWFATDHGLGQIYFVTTNLAAKAEYYEREIDRYHRRTEFGYVIEAHAQKPGSKENLLLNTSDNDGLWTSMYGAGECFAFAATKSPEAKRRAQRAFRALRFLSQVPRGAEHEPPEGFIARSIVKASAGLDPNQGGYSLEAQRKNRDEYDGLWRVYEPRWPLSQDGEYYWKSDTSSDELDGHYFFYPLYYDLVAETEEEKSQAREVVRANIDHLIEHDFSLHDHAGRTRWGVYGPRDMNHDVEWFNERGLKSISILSYLNVAYHMTGDKKYREVARELRNKHAYHINVMWPKYQRGIGSGNQSDDEMAFMCYYNLIKYEPDEALRKMYLASFANSWRQEEPEVNPFFNFCFAALASEATFQSVWGEFDLSPWPTWLSDSVETLQRFPLDRFDWKHINSERSDLIMLSDHWADAFDQHESGRGYRVNGKVIPVDERSFNHWNHDPWRLDTGANGKTLGTGAVFTLPYYMGLYHGFLQIESPRETALGEN